jgi:tetratricopeptide (TPR) repeat protein
MTTANLRSAHAALDAGRPFVARLDIARDPEDVAADLLEAWAAAETALRSLMGGSSLGGQGLIRELRQRELLSLEEGHALLVFLAARDRAERTSYRPTAADVAAARAGFQRLEGRVAHVAEAEFAQHAAPIPAPAARPAATPRVAEAAPVAAAPVSRRGPAFPILLTVLLALLIAGTAYWYFMMRDRAGGALERGVAAYAAGRREAATGEVQKAVRDEPTLALPHVYLGRIAREENDGATALRELQTAVRLEPANAVAQREMGSHLLAAGNPELARRFYVRAVQLDPNDQAAQGFLGCALMRLGRTAEAQRFLSRAGSGSWSSCAAPVASPVAPPGAAAPR